jgi:hypothetical protein
MEGLTIAAASLAFFPELSPKQTIEFSSHVGGTGFEFFGVAPPAGSG